MRIGSKDFNIYANSQFPDANSMNEMPLKSVGNASVLVADIGKAEDSGALQYNIVRIDGQRSVYVPVFKQGGDSNTITIVNGMKAAIKHLVDIPASLKTAVVFDQSVFVKLAISNVTREASIGLVLTGVMILIFLGSPRATIAVLLSVPLSMLVCLLITNAMGGSINTMILGGLALVFSRLIDNGVIVLENIFRHMEMGESPRVAAEKGGTEVSMAVLAATFTTSIVFFPVTFFQRHQQIHLYSAGAGRRAVDLRIVLLRHDGGAALLRQIHSSARRGREHRRSKPSFFTRFEQKFNEKFQHMLTGMRALPSERCGGPALRRRRFWAAWRWCSLVTLPVPGTRLLSRAPIPASSSSTCACPAARGWKSATITSPRSKTIIRSVVKPSDLDMIVSNIGVYPDLSAIYTTNASMDTAFVQTSLKEDHSIGSYEYMQRVREKLSREMPELTAYFQAGGLVDSVINQGLPAPIDIQVSSKDMNGAYALANNLAQKIKTMPNVSGVYIPQDLDYPGIALNIDREKASLIGLSAKDVVDNVITAMTSDGMVAPSYWIDPKSGNNYMVTVQYANRFLNNMSMEDFENIPLRGVQPAGYSPMQQAHERRPTMRANSGEAITLPDIRRSDRLRISS